MDHLVLSDFHLVMVASEVATNGDLSVETEHIEEHLDKMYSHLNLARLSC